MTKTISTEISESVLQFAPESESLSFDITVYNNSDQFASFQVTLVAAGAESTRQDWYRLSPSVSAKIPPGDQARFQAHLLAVPPVPGGFTGTMNLTVKVYSTELRDEDRSDLRLIILGEGLLPPKITIPKKTFKAYPEEVVDILANVYNPNRKSLEVVLDLVGLPPAWFPEGTQKSVLLVPSEEKPVTFVCRLPVPVQAPSDVYSFEVTIVQPATSSPPPQLLLEILPSGFMEFQCAPLEQWIPEKTGLWLNPTHGTTRYALTFQNHSNVELTGTVAVTDEHTRRRQRRPLRLPFRPRPEADDSKSETPLPPGLTVEPEATAVKPGQAIALDLLVDRRLPWLGWPRLKQFQVQASLVDAQLDLRNEEQTLDLHILPVIAFWRQLVGGLVALVLLWLLWLLAQRGHTRAIHTVQFNGTGTEVVSGASDQTIRRWQVRGNRLRAKGVVHRSDKAIRVVEYRPFNNDWIAAGLENGAIQVQSLLSGRQDTFEQDRDDRVFDLAFDQDSRTLWSAHGSGSVLRWQLSPGFSLTEQDTPIEAGFAVSALALVGETDTRLAIGGRFQQLVLVDLEAEAAFEIPYPRSGTQADFINSLETAEEQPNLLAAGDSEGFISLWNMATCRAAAGQCSPIDEWLAHGGDAVRSVALSPDGCHLVSVGDDGRVRLWFLTGAGERRPEQVAGQVVRQAKRPLNAVDLRRRDRDLLIVSGGDDRTVHLKRVRLQRGDQCRAN